MISVKNKEQTLAELDKYLSSTLYNLPYFL